MWNVWDETKHHSHVPTYEKKELPTLTAISGLYLTSYFSYEEEFNIIFANIGSLGAGQYSGFRTCIT
jgi:hypothetical protein